MDVAPLADQVEKVTEVSPPQDSVKTHDQAAPANAADSNAASPSEKLSKPEWLDEGFWDGQKNEIKGIELNDHIKKLTTFKTEAEAAAAKRAEQIPADPTGYVFEIPKDLKLPDGVKPESLHVDEKNPLLVAFREIAHEGEVTKETANKLYGAYVAAELNKVSALNASAAEERGKIGKDAAARVDAVGTFLTSHLGEENAKAMMNNMFTAAQVKGFEALMQKFQGANVVPFNTKGAVTGEEVGKIPGYESMSFEQKRAAQDAARHKR